MPGFIKPVAYVCAFLLAILGGLMLVVAAFSLAVDDHAALAFFESAGITGVLALLLFFVGRGRRFRLVSRQLYVLTTCSWVLMSLAGALPLYYAGYGPPSVRIVVVPF